MISSRWLLLKWRSNVTKPLLCTSVQYCLFDFEIQYVFLYVLYTGRYMYSSWPALSSVQWIKHYLVIEVYFAYKVYSNLLIFSTFTKYNTVEGKTQNRKSCLNVVPFIVIQDLVFTVVPFFVIKHVTWRMNKFLVFMNCLFN